MEAVLHAVGLCPDSNTHVNAILLLAYDTRHYLATYVL